MARTRSMTRNQNHDEEEASSSRKRPMTCAPWSDLDHDLLFLVMMRLGVVDFLFFSGVCKSWRSLALLNRDTFMASTPPVSVTIITTDSDEKACYLEDFEGRKFKTILPDFTGGDCIGITCGYLVFIMRETSDFRLVNPITRHQLHFPDYPAVYHPNRAILVFSASISKWVFVVLFKYCYGMWFCIAGERAWNHVSYRDRILDLHALKGKIYALTSDTPYHDLCELRLGGRQPKLKLLKIKQSDCADLNKLVSSGENFYVIGWDQDRQTRLLHVLDLEEMKWVVPCEEEIVKEYAFFSSELREVVVGVKRESWADPRSHERYADTDNDGEITANVAKMWYFPHECLNVDLIDE